MDPIDLELSVTPEELCRTCLAAVDRNQLKPIFCSEILDGKIVPFPKVIELATGEQLIRDEKLPNGVCGDCKRKLRDLYIFITKVRNSKDLLYDIFNVAKPAPQANEGGADATPKIVKKCAEVQTDAIELERKFRNAPQLVEAGTQCGDIFAGRVPPAVCDMQTQTNEELKSPKNNDISANPVTPANRDCAESTPNLESESDHRLELVQTFAGEEIALNDIDDQDCVSEFEVQLVTHVSSGAEESNTLRPDKTLLKSSKSCGDQSSPEEEQLDSADGSAVVLKNCAEKGQKA
ncbi:zinc finger protein 600 [Anopheles darlingi]|uniref:Zinc finger protein 600 n=1 Tax=Anopheles darlingi TaxID=43151 RepID=W5JPG7_ANODA|nr:zinc finger protein 600 [Anopheles darlingi]